MRPKFLAASAVTLAVALLALSTPTQAKLTCKNVGKRWQVCGEVKPWTSFSAGFGVRFNKSKAGFKSG